MKKLARPVTQSGMLTRNPSSQEWKSDELLEARMVEDLVNEQPPGLFTQHTDRFIVDHDDMDSLPLLRHGVNILFLLNHLCRRGSASTA